MKASRDFTKRHIAAFVHYVTEGEMSHTAAWEKIAASTILTGKARADLAEQCVAAATAARKVAA